MGSMQSFQISWIQSGLSKSRNEVFSADAYGDRVLTIIVVLGLIVVVWKGDEVA